jgi:cytochrome c oxidase subunit 6a
VRYGVIVVTYLAWPWLPAFAVIAWVRNVEAEHAEHQEHLKKENDGHLPETPAYDYLNKRVKPYPWGANSLFFNPHVRSTLLLKAHRDA